MTIRMFLARILLGFIAAVLMSEPATAAGTTAPTKSITEVQLQDPTRGAALSWLDLDSGKRYTFAESSPEDFEASERWLKKSGADLMTESRAPVSGFVSHDLVLVETDLKLDGIVDYDTVRGQLKMIEPQHFQTIKLVTKKTFLFRTREGAIGAMEASPADDESGIAVRYKVLHPFTRIPPLKRTQVNILPLGEMIQKQTERVEFARRNYGEKSSTFTEARDKLKMLEHLKSIAVAEQDPWVATIKIEKAEIEFSRDEAKKRLGADAHLVGELQNMIDALSEAIAAAGPLPQPATTASSTRPNG